MDEHESDYVRNHYTKEFKIQVCKEHVCEGASLRSLSIKHKLSSHSLIHDWLRRYKFIKDDAQSCKIVNFSEERITVFMNDHRGIHHPCILRGYNWRSAFNLWLVLSPTRFNLTYLTDNTLPWGNATTGGTFMLGKRELDTNSRGGFSSIVTFNEKMLQNSSQLLIAATVVHETLHAYINYNMAMANYNIYYDRDNWMLGLNNFYLMNSLPPNYSNHTMMLEDYFDKSMAVLQAWNAKQGFIYSMKDMASAMLYGLDTYDTGTSQTQINNINAVFQSVKTKYGITASDLTTFNKANLIATTNKLPTTGCN